MLTRVKKLLFLSEEAKLYDSYMYIAKAIVAVTIAYVIGSHDKLLSKDIISVLFGLMMTLEPVTLTGIKSGVSQLTATILGALVTAVLVILFGINLGVITAAIGLTLYVGIKVNYRFVSPVAIFTAIYMTQYVQKTLDGSVSMLLTFQLRMTALTFGIVVAIGVNFVFSLIFYKKLKEKRWIYLATVYVEALKQFEMALVQKDIQTIDKIRASLPELFNQIDWLFGLTSDLQKERYFYSRLMQPIVGWVTKKVINKHFFDQALQNTVLLRESTHLLYDSCQWIKINGWKDCSETCTSQIQDCIKHMMYITKKVQVAHYPKYVVVKDNRLEINGHLMFEAINKFNINE